MRTALRALAVAILLGTFTMFGSVGAANADSTYGQHVRQCAQTMGFDATHNPGMHHGFSGWDPGHVC